MGNRTSSTQPSGSDAADDHDALRQSRVLSLLSSRDGAEELLQLVGDAAWFPPSVAELARRDRERQYGMNPSSPYIFSLPDLDPAFFVESRESEDLTCPVCLTVPLTPMALPCRHVCCARCIAAIATSASASSSASVEHVVSKRCPTCRREFGDDLSIHAEVRSRIERQTIECPHRHEGCPQQMRIGEYGRTLAAHLQNDCEQHQMVCRGCTKQLNRKQRQEHQCPVAEAYPQAASSYLASSASSSSTPSLPVVPVPSASASLHSLPINTFCLRDRGFTILHQAVALGSPSLVHALLLAGADPNARTAAFLDGHDADRKSRGEYFYRSAVDPRDLAIKTMGVTAYADRLTKPINSNIKYRELGFTPLMLAVLFTASESVCEVVSLLLRFGADPNATTNHHSWSVAMLAASRHLPPLWSLLLDHGLNELAMNAEGEAAATVAATWAGRDNVRMIDEERAMRARRRTRARDTLVAHRMAQVCIDICLQYAGL